MARTVLYDGLSDRFDSLKTPGWYSEAVSWLRGDEDRGLFGLYLYNLVRTRDDIEEIVNVGTARGHSAVCAAKGLQAAGRSGTVHTIDVIDPDEERNWHGSQPDSDPLEGIEVSMRELVGRFVDPSEDGVVVELHAGDSSDILRSLDASPDLVFHDGLHIYSKVRADVDAANALSADRPIHVFDDCYLFSDRWEWRPFTSERWYDLDEAPKIGGLIRTLRSLSVSRKRFPGVTLAVRAVIDEGRSNSVEVVHDPDHSPITAVFPA